MRHIKRPASEASDDPRLEGYFTFHGEDPFEQVNGPFCWKIDTDGAVRCAFVAERKALNDDGVIHGGCLMAFADFAIFRFSEPHRQGAVTLSFNADFTAPGYEGDFIECTGEIVHQTKGMLFLRGDVFTVRENEGRIVLMTYMATLKKLQA